jgi:serine/threonine-protein kinase RsbW
MPAWQHAAVCTSSEVPPVLEAVVAAMQGDGFDPDAVPDPLAPENLEKPSGRGLLLMRHYLTSVDFNEKGNHVTLCRCRSA